jgi:PII-like signaling protein
MRGLKGEQVLMRIHVGERDQYHGKPLYKAIVELLRERGYAGATVLRGIMGFGASGHVSNAHMEIMSYDLPIVVECVETQERIETILPEIDAMVDAGLITLERAKVILYRPHVSDDTSAAARPTEQRIDITGDWRMGTRDQS